MTVICISAVLLVCAPTIFDPPPPLAPPARGGHAKIIPARGGRARVVLEPIGSLAVWICIHVKEAAWNDPGDPYWGGLQMDRGFMGAYGRDMIRLYHGWADRWPPREQMVVAWRAVVGYAGIPARGYGPWPHTRLGCA